MARLFEWLLVGASPTCRAAGILSASEGEPAMRVESEYKGLLRAVLEAAGVEFIAENGSGPGVRLRKGRPAAAI